MSESPNRVRPAQAKPPVAKSQGPQVQGGDGTGEEEEEVDPSTGMPLWMDIALPWASSVMLHLGVGLIILFLVLVVRPRAGADDEDRANIVIPTATLTDAELGNGGGIPHPGTGGDPNRDAAQDQIKDVLKTDGWASKQSDATANSFLEGDASENVVDAIVRGNGATAGGSGHGGTGQGEGGPLAPYGTPGGGNGMGPKSNFYGTGGSAMRIVYLLDHSGSLLDNFNFLQKEVKRSVDNLLPVQQFGLIVFAGQEEGTEILTPGSALVRATAEVKRESGLKMDRVVSKGKNDDEFDPFFDAFQKAFAMKPQLIYFLTDGRFDPRLIEKVKELNAGNKTKIIINTIAFVGKDDGYFDQMKQISTDSGGKFKFVSERDVAGPSK